MTVINKLSCMRGRRDETPNKELAKELAETRNHPGIQELIENLKSKDKDVKSDCIKVLYEIGYINPRLIERYVDDFLDLLNKRNNRLIWGAMIALSTIAHLRAEQIWNRLDEVLNAIDKGTVITVDAGISVLAGVATGHPQYRERIFPILLDQIKTCAPRQLAIRTERALTAIDESNKKEFIAILKLRERELNPSQLARVEKIVRSLDK